MPGTVGNIALGLTLDNKGFTQKLNLLANNSAKLSSKSFSDMGKSLGDNMGKSLTNALGAALSTVALTSFVKECLDLGSELAEVQNVVDVTFGSMSDSINQFAKDAMETYGLSETVAKRYAGTFGAMSKAFGFTTAEAVNMSEAITGLTADVSSFYNLDTDTAYTKLKSIFTGETESLKDLGIVMSQTALDQYAMNEGFGKTTKNMTEQEKVMLRYQFVMSQLSSASGDFQRTSDGWANQTRVLKLRMDALKASLGQSFINILTPLVKSFNSLIGTMTKAADSLRDFTNVATGNVNVTSAITQDANETSEAIKSIGTESESTKKKLEQLAGYDELNVISKSSDTSSSTDSSSDEADTVASAIQSGAAGAGIDYSDNIASKYIEAIKDSWNNADFSSFGGTLTTKIDSQLKKVPWKDIKSTANTAAKSLATFLNGIFGNEEFFADTGEAVAEAINTKWGAENSAVSNFKFDSLGKSLGKGINSTLSTLDWESRLDTSLKWGEGVAKALNSYLKETDFNMVGGTVGNFLLSKINSCYGFVTNADYKELGKSVSDSINGFFSSMAKIDKTGKNGWQKLGVSFAGIVNGMKEMIVTAFKGIEWKDILDAMDDAWWSLDFGSQAIILTGLAFKLGAGQTIGSMLMKAFKIESDAGEGAVGAKAVGTKIGTYIFAGITAATVGWRIGNQLGKLLFGDEFGEYDMTPGEVAKYLMEYIQDDVPQSMHDWLDSKGLIANKTNDDSKSSQYMSQDYSNNTSYKDYLKDVESAKTNSNDVWDYLSVALKIPRSELASFVNKNGFNNYSDDQLKSLRLDSSGNLYSLGDMIVKKTVQSWNDNYQATMASKNANGTNGKSNWWQQDGHVTLTIDGKTTKNFKDSKALFDGVSDKTATKTIKGKTDKTFNTTKKLFGAVGSNSATKTIKGTVAKTFTSVSNTFKNLKSTSIAKTIKGIKDTTFDKAKEGWESLKSKSVTVKVVASSFEKVKSTFNTLIRSVLNHFNINLINPIKDAFSSAKDKLGSVFSISSIKIPGLASGGYIAANTPRLVMIGDNRNEGEIVAPESKLRQAVRDVLYEQGGASGDVYVENVLTMDGEVVYRKMERIARQKKKQTGDTGLA